MVTDKAVLPNQKGHSHEGFNITHLYTRKEKVEYNNKFSDLVKTINQSFAHYKFVNLIATGICGPIVKIVDTRVAAGQAKKEYVVKAYKKEFDHLAK